MPEEVAHDGKAELVVLLGSEHERIGVAAKASVHSAATPLHLAFSTHIFNRNGQVLMTRRALSKKTWPGVWANSVCGHPAPEEEIATSVRRRARYELGLELENIALVLPEFHYRAVDASGIVENEYCPVFTAVTRTEPVLRADEVLEFVWADPGRARKAIELAPWAFAPWTNLQLKQMADLGESNIYPAFRE